LKTFTKIIVFLLLIRLVVAADYYIVEIVADTRSTHTLINDLNLDAVNEGLGDRVEIVADQATIDKLVQSGVQHQVIRPLSNRYVPDYQSYEEVNTVMNAYHSYFPEITEVVQIGVSTNYHYPIYGMKISDNPTEREDETVVWIDGVHHAREPMGMMSCLVLMENLLNNFILDTNVARLVNELEIWIVPILNTEGYKYFIEETANSPWWRKNQRDNNENGDFDFEYDGVDLNRNYDSAWATAPSGSPDPASWVYKGPTVFSESEVRAKKQLIEYLRPISGITYHSYGQIIYYKSGINGHATNETALVDNFAQQMANHLPQQDGTGTYTLGGSWDEAPMSYYWAYEKMGVFEMLVETGVVFVPPFATAQQVAVDNLGGAMYVLERSLEGPGIRGHAFSNLDSSPIVAQVKIVEYWDPGMSPRMTEVEFGRFNRFTSQGSFTLEIQAAGYRGDTLTNVVVDSGWTNVEIGLDPLVMVNLTGTEIDDDSDGLSQGNSNNLINAGERVELDITVTNTGSLLSNPVTIILSTEDSYITLLDSIHSLDSLASDEEVTVSAALAFEVASDYPTSQTAELMLSIIDSVSVPWLTALSFPVYEPTVAVNSDISQTIPVEFALHFNYPNPFNPTTTIGYDLPVNANVNIAIYDLLGKQVTTLVNEDQLAGTQSIIWDATDATGTSVTSGVYFYRLQTGSFQETGKMVLLK